MTDTTLDAVPDGMTHEEWAAGLRAEQRFALAVPAGLIAAVAGAVLWAAVTYLTGAELGLVAIGVGALVGVAVRRAGRGVDQLFGLWGGFCAALGWALGTLLTVYAMVAKEVGAPFLDVLAKLPLSETMSLAAKNADLMELLFLGVAVWEGYKLSFRAQV